MTLLSINYKVLGFCSGDIMYKDSVDGEEVTEDIEDFIATCGWRKLNEKDRKKLLSYIKEKNITTVEGFKIPLGPTSFNSIFGYKFLPLFTAIFCFLTITSPMLDPMLFKWGNTHLAGSFFVFSLGYIFLDLINEIYGFKNARMTVYTAVILSFFFSLIMWLSFQLPIDHNSPFGHVTESIYNAYSIMPFNIFMCGLVILVADMINIFLFQILKQFTRKKMLWLRSLMSNGICQFITNMLYMMFANIMNYQISLGSILNYYSQMLVYIVFLIPLLYFLVWVTRDVQKSLLFLGPKSVQFFDKFKD